MSPAAARRRRLAEALSIQEGAERATVERVAAALEAEVSAAALEAGSKVTNANKQLRLVTANVARNAELRGRLLAGAARPADVARATAEELAPDAVRVRKQERGAQQLQAEVAAAREHEQLAEEVAKSRRLELAGADRRLAAADDPHT